MYMAQLSLRIINKAYDITKQCEEMVVGFSCLQSCQVKVVSRRAQG